MNEANKLQGAKDAANAYVEQMRPGDQAGLLTFNTRVDYVQPLTTDHTMLSSAIHKLVAHDDTAMIDALSRANDILKDIPGRKAIIVLTDGLDNVSKTKPEDVINAIGPSGLSISTIGLGDPNQTGVNSGLDETGLMSLAERAGGVYSYANDPTALRGLFERYGRALQSEYSLTYTSPSKLRDGVSRILTVSLATQPDKAAQAQYNPGGVLPEVAQSISWPVFGGILAGLMVLLFIPFLINRIAMAPVGGKQNGAKKAGGKQKPRIKLN
jgi:VWFA-related protein